MSAHAYPPDRDPELRRTFALDSAQQIAELRRLTGDPVSPAAPSSFAFEPVGVKLKETPKGALSCIPRPFIVGTLQPNARELCILVDHDLFWHLRRHAPRTAEGIAELLADLDTILPHRGIIRIPCSPPSGWTLRDLRDVMARMADAVPRTGANLKPSPDVWITWHHGVIEINVHVDGEGMQAFLTTLRLSAAAGVAVRTLVSKFPARSITNEMLWTRLAEIDAVVNQSEATNERRTLDDDVDDDVDDDTDAIEQLARRTLHGRREQTAQAAALPEDMLQAAELLVLFNRIPVKYRDMVLDFLGRMADLKS